jgi:membrane protease YdiL (CAAX protease family)
MFCVFALNPKTNPVVVNSPTRKNFYLGLFLVGFFAVWTAWAFLLTQHPALNDGVVRAVVRLLLWVVPALLFVRFAEGPQPPVLERLGLRHGAGRGMLIGLAGFLALMLLAAAQYGSALLHVRLPTDSATWLNPVLTAPLAEELVFRGVVFRVMREQFGACVAAPASAALFALIHLPYWAMSGEKTGAALAAGLGSVFLLGVFFAALFHWSKSLWAPLVCHSLNNLLHIALGG